MLRHAATSAARAVLPAAGAAGRGVCFGGKVAVRAEAPAKTLSSPLSATWMREMPVVHANPLQRSSLLQQEIETLQMLNRNARKPKKANHGKRPCSHVRRREKRRKVKTN
ncbi:Hypothetical Protein FCC1311_100882 [Hondaea fermentalgiana]|uniref:Uncharacterized protein n=1 Tax=Hondaea fermentalgiana TaxID=2315210 RepID=A0A2R5GTF7_9STRA|nr:Hypothetical Protein FCC1311_100882 [Hondaea fermentalgiana]|eukprot:GBG33865.1 Hypothetical Protein FCC1311_100882 [Hondaea fermentalgiana]